MRHMDQEAERPLEHEQPAPFVNSSALLVCMYSLETLERKEFNRKFELAEAQLQYGRDEDLQYFICLCLNEKADYEQFKHGTLLLEQYLEEHPYSRTDLHGFLILVNRLDQAIKNKWSSWKTLLNDKKTLKAEVESLQTRINELQQQIEQLKSIEDIIESRGIGQP